MTTHAVPNRHAPQQVKVCLSLIFRQWVGNSGVPGSGPDGKGPDGKGPQTFAFTVLWTPLSKRASVDMVRCDQPEPQWQVGERTKVVELLRQAVKQQTGREATYFNMGFIEWGTA